MGGYAEDPVVGFNEMFTNYKIGLMSLLIICSILFFNLNGITLTKHVSCVFRAFWDATRTVSVWFVSLALGLETLVWRSFFIQMLGFLLLVCGNLTYNEVIEWKIFGINKYMSKYLDEDGNLRQKRVDNRDATYQSVQPDFNETPQ